jgi:protein-disulfide isomerase
VALFGVAWFVFVLLLAFADKWVSPAMGENLTGYLFVFSTLALAAILYFAYAAFFVLKVVCVLCLLTYAAVIGLFIVAGISTTIPMISIPRRLLRDLRTVVTSPVAVVVVLLFLAGAGSAVAFFPHEAVAAIIPGQPAPAAASQTQDQRTEFDKYWETLPRVTVPVPNPGAAVLIVKFTDFQCEYCAASYKGYKSILERYQAEVPGAVKLVSKMYPLQPECNVNVPGPKHAAACDAAAAWIMARGKGRADAMEDWLYTNQLLLSPSFVREGARTIGMVQDFAAQYPRVLEEIKADAGLGRLLGINSTPTFFINGVKVPGFMAPQYFDMAIAYELRKAGKIK